MPELPLDPLVAPLPEALDPLPVTWPLELPLVPTGVPLEPPLESPLLPVPDGAPLALAPLAVPLEGPVGRGPGLALLQPSIEATASAATSLIERMVFIFMPLGSRRTLARGARTVKVQRNDVLILGASNEKGRDFWGLDTNAAPYLGNEYTASSIALSRALGCCTGTR